MKSMLKAVLAEHHMTMRRLAEAVGVHEVTVSRWATDRGISSMSLRTAEEVARVVGCRVSDLYREGGE